MSFMNKHLVRTFFYFFLAWVAGLAMVLAGAPLQTFQSGDRWCALGDSITAGGFYTRYIELFYRTRFPALDFDVINSGINGDTAHNALDRLQWDCLDNRPTVVSVMLGMNDVKPSTFKPEYKDQDSEKESAQRAETYDQAMRQLVQRLLSSGVKVILITPSIFDETADMPRVNFPGCGAALAGYAERVRAMARDFLVPLVDFNAPMTSINAALQERDPHFSIVGPDRIHPTEVGHFVMAYEFLRAQQVNGVVSRIVIDAVDGKTEVLENCTVTSLKAGPDGVSLTYLENSLPFPVEVRAEPALGIVPFTEELNRQDLQVQGLIPGEYELSIDGKKIRKYSADQLREGVNLALEKNTPQYLQAVAVRSLLTQKWAAVTKLRSVAYIEHNAWPTANRPLDFDSVSVDLDARLAAMVGADEAARDKMKTTYLERKKQEATLRQEAEDAVKSAREATRPKSHQLTLRRTS